MYSDTWHHIADMPAIRLRSRNSIDNTEARKGSTRGDGEGRSGSGAEGRRLDPERKGTGKRRLVWQQVANRARWRRTKKREGGERGRWCGVAAVPFRCAAGSSVVGVSDPFINISKRLNFAALRANKISSRWKMWTGRAKGGGTGEKIRPEATTHESLDRRLGSLQPLLLLAREREGASVSHCVVSLERERLRTENSPFPRDNSKLCTN